jgi:hypothetical protein
MAAVLPLLSERKGGESRFYSWQRIKTNSLVLLLPMTEKTRSSNALTPNMHASGVSIAKQNSQKTF